MSQADNYMGFDEYIYIVTAYDEDGTESRYEFGNLKHAQSVFGAEKVARLERYKDGKAELIDEKSGCEISRIKMAHRKYKQVHKSR